MNTDSFINEIEIDLYHGNVSLEKLAILEKYYDEKKSNFESTHPEDVFALSRTYEIARRYAAKKVKEFGKYILYITNKTPRNKLVANIKYFSFNSYRSFMTDSEGFLLVVQLLSDPMVSALRVQSDIAEQYPELYSALLRVSENANKQCTTDDKKSDSEFVFAKQSLKLIEHNTDSLIDLDLPRELHIDLAVGKCNIACRFCRCGIENIPTLAMSFDIYKQAIAAIPKNLFIKTVLTPFTEPFITKNYMELLEYALIQRPHANIGFNTNAAPMHKKRCERLIDLQLKYINISLNMPDRESYKWFHGRDFYERVTENIMYLVALREQKGSEYPKIYVQLLEHEKVRDKLAAAQQYWATVADSAWIRRIAIPGDTPEVRKELLEKIGDDPHKEQIQTKYPCLQCYITLGVDINGYYLPCTNIETARSINIENQNIYDEMVIGHVRDMSFLDAWKSEKFKKLRALQFAGRLDACRGCLNRQYTESRLFSLKNAILKQCYSV